jgi:putative glutamine amidotransferase
MTKPVIILTAGQRTVPLPACEPTTLVGVDIDFLVAVSLAGGAPVLLPGVADHAAIAAVMRLADGLLLTGGGDIHAEVYGEEPHPESALHDTDRDNMEIEVARLALEIGLPILGICRGLQLLNVVQGGTLVQHIPSQVPDALPHNAAETEFLYHPITIEPDSRLAAVMHATTMLVNSWHHQAVKTVGTGLRVTARADDGVVEALEAAVDRPLLAVQCHPEAGEHHYPSHLPLFHWLIEEAKKYQARKG